MKIVVTDVSVFFDLFEIQVLDEFFTLDWEVYTTDFVYNEILQADQREAFGEFVRSRHLKILSFSNEEEMMVRNFKTKLRIRSIADKTILWKALNLEATLLTCDMKLRKEAQGHGLEVRGSIWVIEQLVVNKIIYTNKAINLLENLKKTNNRLPIDRINKLIKQWRK